jgi:hypothetical protein
MAFAETYGGSGTIVREAKHNFFARQIYDDRLNTDIYLMTHLQVAGDGELPGTARQKKLVSICLRMGFKKQSKERRSLFRKGFAN